MNPTMPRARRISLFLALLFAALAAGVAPFGAQPASATDLETLQVGMPFSGKWARSAAGQNNCLNFGTHPSCHTLHQTGASWSTDVYAGAGTTVAAQFANPTGSLSLQIEYVGTAPNCSAGKNVRVRVKVDNVDVGWVQYVHLDTTLQNGHTGNISNGAVLGKTKFWTYDSDCWQVSTAAGVHVHMEAGPGTRDKACYAGLASGSTYSAGISIGVLGDTGTTTNQTQCGTIDTDGDGVVDSQDSCPTVVGYGSNHGCPVESNVKADYNTDSRSDVVGFYGYNDGSVNMYRWSGNVNQTTSLEPTAWTGTGWDGSNRIMPAGVGDVDGDGKQDVVTFFRHDNGMMDMNIWYGDGAGAFTRTTPWHVSSGWLGDHLIPAGVGDFDTPPDGKADIAAFYRYETGGVNLYVWKGAAGRSTGSLSPMTVWSVSSGWDGSRIMPAGVGDYDGDTKRDVATFYRHDNGMMDMNVYYGGGSVTANSFTLGRPWHVDAGWLGDHLIPVGVGRFDSDSKADVAAFYRYDDGGVNLYVWKGQQDRTGNTQATIYTPWSVGAGSGWDGTRIMPAGTGDFDGNGKLDVAAFYRYDDLALGMNIWYGDPSNTNLAVYQPWYVGSEWDGNLFKPVAS